MNLKRIRNKCRYTGIRTKTGNKRQKVSNRWAQAVVARV